MKFIKALTKYPATCIFRVEDSDDDNPTKWDLQPVSSNILSESDGFFILKGKNILPDGSVRDCYIDISLPERINDLAYFFDGKSLKTGYPHEFDGDIICAVPIDCFGEYELFYSSLNPEVGIDILKKALVNFPGNQHIAEDLGYILRDEGRFKEAAELFQVAVEGTPSSEYIYNELADCYEEIGDTDKAEKYKDMFNRKNSAS